VFQPGSKGITGLRLEVLADSRLPKGGPGWGENGNFVLSELTLQAAPAEGPGTARSIALRDATADFSQATGVRWDVRGVVDGNGTTGWAVLPEVNKDHTAVFEPAEDVGDGQAARLTVRLVHQYSDPTHNLGRFRWSFTNDRATLQATRIRLDLKDGELVDCQVALGTAYAQQGRTSEAAAAFARAREQAPDRASKARIITAAAPLAGMLEKLTVRAVGDTQFQAELARHLDEQGNAPLADAARARARALYEKQRAAEPDNAVLAGELADLLLIDSRAGWTVLKPSAVKSDGGATLTLQADGSILASGINSSGDIYTISAASPLDRIAAVRLEALPDPSLPSKGPGRHPSGNFQLSAFRLYHPANDDASWVTPLPVESACASFDYKASNADIAGTIDESLNKVWHVSGRPGEAHQGVFLVQEAAAAAASRGRPLVIELRHRGAGEEINLGRFRLSVSGDPAIFARQRRRFAAMKLADPWARLAAAYRHGGDQKALDSLLKQRPAAADGLGDLYAADQDWERAIAVYRKGITLQPADGTLLTKLATAYQSAGRTREVVPLLAKASAANPQDTTLSLKVAALQAWYGQEKELAATRQRILAFAQGSSDVLAADRAAKACSIIPTTDKAVLEAALAFGRKTVKAGQVPPQWSLLALGMAEYRSGNGAAAVETLQKAAKAGSNNPRVTGISAFYRAMSLFRQGKTDEARKLVIAAVAAMKPPPADLENPLAGDTHHDDLILWLAHKEAKAMIQFDAPAAAPATPGGK
jgi:tetratricopeptide (TPR) repeat protein